MKSLRKLSKEAIYNFIEKFIRMAKSNGYVKVNVTITSLFGFLSSFFQRYILKSLFIKGLRLALGFWKYFHLASISI